MPGVMRTLRNMAPGWTGWPTNSFDSIKILPALQGPALKDECGHAMLRLRCPALPSNDNIGADAEKNSRNIPVTPIYGKCILRQLFETEWTHQDK